MIALITARGGSTRLVNKATRQVAGFPALAWAIGAARRSSAACVILSSDDDHILRTGEIYGAQPLKRPAEYATEHASRESAVAHALSVVSGSDDEKVCVISPCHPLRRADHIDEASAMLDQWDSVVTVVREPHAIFTWQGGKPLYEPANRPRTQDVDLLTETGAIYGIRRGPFLRAKCLVYGKTGLLKMEQWESVDIDDEWTLEVADVILMRSLLRRQAQYHLPEAVTPA